MQLCVPPPSSDVLCRLRTVEAGRLLYCIMSVVCPQHRCFTTTCRYLKPCYCNRWYAWSKAKNTVKCSTKNSKHIFLVFYLNVTHLRVLDQYVLFVWRPKFLTTCIFVRGHVIPTDFAGMAAWAGWCNSVLSYLKQRFFGQVPVKSSKNSAYKKYKLCATSLFVYLPH